MKTVWIVAALFTLSGTSAVAQGKKTVIKNKIESVTEVDNIEGKTVTSRKEVFDKSGKTAENYDYDKYGHLKDSYIIKYNSDGDEVEETVFDGKKNATEKHVFKYNGLGEKTIEEIYDEKGAKIKYHVYTYDNRGLKTERKTFDPSGKLIATRKYNYTYRK